MKTILFSAFILSFFLLSCSNTEQINAIKNIDSLLSVVDGIKTDMAFLENDSSKAFYSNMKEEVDFIGKTITDLPKDSAQRTSLSLYANYSKGFKKIYKNLSVYEGEIANSEKQLQDLKSDIKNDLLKKDDIEKYIMDEKTAVVLLEMNVKEDIDKYHIIKNEVLAIQPVISKLSESLRKTNNTNK
ncbi:MAG: hypothetical protein CVU05_12650 [Bacteroidetes bacterium HGW-Bacteroidetes-21]|jgi:hypothetical protein|nr:MAG: hypothetical protein CVU05_12650 [Bacteroidetes bacterium HGW-Bacteroidetes-21]